MGAAANLQEACLAHAHEPNSHDHNHRSADRKSLTIALAMTGGFLLIEIVGGLLSNSLALLADAAHMVTDVSAIGLALLAFWVAGRPATFTRTFGFHRAEVLAALANAASLWAITIWIGFEAYDRLTNPQEIQGGLVLVVGAAGLVVNLIVAWVLLHSSGHSLNLRAALLHVLSDLMGSVAVLIGSILILAFGWYIADAILSIFIAVLVLVSSGHLLWKVGRVLMEAAPEHLDLDVLCQRLENIPGVTSVHDIHSWTITDGYYMLIAHVTANFDNQASHNRILTALQDVAYRDFGITHLTVQLEDSTFGCSENHHSEHSHLLSPEAGGR